MEFIIHIDIVIDIVIDIDTYTAKGFNRLAKHIVNARWLSAHKYDYFRSKLK